MSSLRRHYVPFGPFAPDGPEFGAEPTKLVQNLAPVFNTYRPIPKLKEVGRTTSSVPVNGAFAHLTSISKQLAFMRPSTDDQVGAWYDTDGKLQTDLYDEINDFDADDRDWIVTHAGATAAGDEYKTLLSTPSPLPVVTTDHKMKFKYQVYNATGAWTIRLTLTDGVTTETHDIVGSGDMSVYDVETWTVPSGSVAALFGPNYDDVELHVEVVSMTTDDERLVLQPEFDGEKEGWTDQDDSSVQLYVAIDEGSDPGFDDDDYVKSDSIEGGSSSEVSFLTNGQVLGDNVVLPNANTTELAFRYKVSSSSGDLEVSVKQEDPDDPDDELTRATYLIQGVSTSITTVTWVLSAEEAAAIDWSKDVRVVFKFTNTGDSIPSELYPTGDDLVLRWTDEGGSGSNLHDSVNASDDATFIKSSDDNQSNSVIFDLDDVPTPSDANNVDVVIRARYTGTAPTGDGKILGFSVSGGGFKGWDIAVTDSWKTYTKTVSASIITDWSALKLRVDRNGGYGSAELQVSELYIEPDSVSTQAFIYAYEWQGPTKSNVRATWARLEAPSPSEDLPGDLIKVYAGTESKLWEVDAELGTFTDRTRLSGDYATGNDKPKPWSFTHFGDWIIATNWVDPVQVLKPGDTEFSDLILDDDPPNTQQPQFRHVAICGGQLVGCNVNPDSYASGKPYTAWPSGALDPEHFLEVDAFDSQSVLFQVVQSMGQIQGLIGGEYGGLIKRNSLHRMVYEGPPRIWRFDDVDKAQGTPYPRSFLAFGSDLYFWGNKGIFRSKDGQQSADKISTLAVEKFLFDRFEEHTVAPFGNEEEAINESIVFGCRDPYAGVIWWFYRTRGESSYLADRWLCYNPHENKWAFGYVAGMNATEVIAAQNIASENDFITKALIIFRHDGTDLVYSKFEDIDTYTGEFLVETLTSRQFPGVKTGQDIAISGMRPIFKMDPSEADKPSFRLKLSGSQDPQLSSNLNTTGDLYYGEDETNPQDGWVRFEPISGEFFTLEFAIPSLRASTIRELSGMQFLYTFAGDF